MRCDVSGELSPKQEQELLDKMDRVLFKYFAHENPNYVHGWEGDGMTIIMYNSFHEYYGIPEYTYTVHASKEVHHFPEFYPTTYDSRGFRNEMKELLAEEGYELVRIEKGSKGDYFGCIKFNRK